MSQEKKLIVVLGMHRSGTSAITRGLQVLGASLGERLMPAVEGNNDKGFFEDIEINAFNNELLSAIKSDWFYLSPVKEFQLEKLRREGYFLRAVALIQEKIKSEDVFAFKDPRVAKLLPFWKEVFSRRQINVNYVLALRHPLSVVNSLAKRDGFAAEHSYLLWLGHILESLTGSRGAPRVLVDFDRLMQSPDAELVRIATSLNLEVCPAELQNYKIDFLDQGLRHTVFELNDLLLDSACPAIVIDVYSALLKVASGQLTLDDDSILADISNWSDEFDRIKTSLSLVDTLLAKTLVTSVAVTERDGQIASLSQAVAERDAQLGDLGHALAEREGQIASLNQGMHERDAQLEALHQALAERDGQLAGMHEALAQREVRIGDLSQAVAERDVQLGNLGHALAERDGQIASLNQGMHERDAQLAALHQTLTERDEELAMLKNAVTEYVARIKRLERLAEEQVQKIHTAHDQLQKVEQDRHLLENAMKEKEAQIFALTEDLSKIKEEVYIFRAEKHLIYESIQNTKNIFLATTN